MADRGINIATVVNMGNNSLVVALFDLDGTLCNARYHLASSIAGFQFKNPTRIPSAIVFLINQFARLLFWKAGLITYTHVVQAGIPELAHLLEDLSKSEASNLFSKAARATVNTARQETLNILRWHQEEGHTVILISSGFQPFLREVGSLLGINHTIGTALEKMGNIYTGRLAGPLCHGDDRVRLLRRFIEASGSDVNLPSSFAYGDRALDIPTLEIVGHPVAVYPDKELLNYANERGWTVTGRSRE